MLEGEVSDSHIVLLPIDADAVVMSDPLCQAVADVRIFRGIEIYFAVLTVIIPLSRIIQFLKFVIHEISPSFYGIPGGFFAFSGYHAVVIACNLPDRVLPTVCPGPQSGALPIVPGVFIIFQVLVIKLVVASFLVYVQPVCLVRGADIRISCYGHKLAVHKKMLDAIDVFLAAEHRI